MSFPFEKLDLYQVAVELAEISELLISKAGKAVSRGFADQLSRASLSIPLNIAEGNGRWHLADKRNFFWIARGSTFECVPLLELLKRRQVICEREASSYRDRLITIGKMLTNLVKAHEPDSDTRVRGPIPNSSRAKPEANHTGAKPAQLKCLLQQEWRL